MSTSILYFKNHDKKCNHQKVEVCDNTAMPFCKIVDKPCLLISFVDCDMREVE